MVTKKLKRSFHSNAVRQSNISSGSELNLNHGISIANTKKFTLRNLYPIFTYKVRSHVIFSRHVTMWQFDWPELLGMARAKESAQRYQTIPSAVSLVVEMVGHVAMAVLWSDTEVPHLIKIWGRRHTSH